MPTLHLGTKDTDAVLAVLPRNVRTFIEYDQWEEWGESEREHNGTHHVIVMGRGIADGLSVNECLTIVTSLTDGTLLEPMRGPTYQRGIIASITLDDDWSESLLNVSLGWRGLADHRLSQTETVTR